MTAEYEITKDDFYAFNLYHIRHSSTARRQYLRSWLSPAFIWLLICTGIWYLGDRERGTPLQTFLDLLPLFSGIPLYLICFPWAYRRKLRKIIKGMAGEGPNRGLFTCHRVTITPETITDVSEFEQTSTAWRAIENVIKTNKYAYIYNTTMSAIIIPKRAFTSSSEFDEFVQTAGNYHKKAAA